MKIIMPKKMYKELINRCKKTGIELSGTMETAIDDDNIIITQVWTDINSIEKNTDATIDYIPSLYGPKTRDEMINCNGIHISYHFHPGIDSQAILSNGDKEHTKGRSNLAKLVSETYHLMPIDVIDCIVTCKEMAFYLYDEQSDSSVRIPLFVDGQEIIPSHEHVHIERRRRK